MRFERSLAAIVAVAISALVAPAATAPAAAAEVRGPACNVTYEPRGGGSFSVWARCLADRSAAITDVRIEYQWHGTWWDNFTTDHASTVDVSVAPGSVSWRTGPADFGSDAPFRFTDTPVSLFVDGHWQAAEVQRFAETLPLTDPGLPGVVPLADRPPASPVCVVDVEPTGGTKSSIWANCAAESGTPIDDVRISYRWRDSWWPDFTTAHAATTLLERAGGTIRWRTGHVDFGSTAPFDGIDTPVDVFADGRWQPAEVQLFQATQPLRDPGMPVLGNLRAQLAEFRQRVATVATHCPVVPEGATNVRSRIDIDAGTCTTTGTVEICEWVQYLCDHQAELVEALQILAAGALAVAVVPMVIAAAPAIGASLGSLWPGLVGTTAELGAGAGGALAASTAVSISADAINIGAAAAVTGIGAWLALHSSSVDDGGSDIPDLGDDWVPRPASQITDSIGCDDVAEDIIGRLNGGEIYEVHPRSDPLLSRYRGAETGWGYHSVVEKNGRVFDAFGPRTGVPVSEWKQLWQHPELLDFGGL